MNPGCSSVPALSIPPGFDPSGKYVVIMDAYGNSRILASPNGKSILFYDGADVYFATGANDFPLELPGIPKTHDPVFGLLAQTISGRFLSLVNESATEMVLQSKLGQLYFAPINVEIGGRVLPNTGTGIAISQPDGDGAITFFGLKGLVYINDDGTVTRVENGINGQFLAMSGGTPTFLSLPSGNIASGSAIATLEGVSAGTLSASQINVTVPLIRLTDGVTEVQMANVNVTFDFANGVANNGLDTGAEQANKWYYLYVISDGATAACVASESMDAPDLTGFGAFQFSAFVGVFRNDGSGNITTFVQRGRDIYTAPVVMSDDVSITTAFAAVPQSVPMSTIIPPVAKTCTGIAGGSAAGGASSFLSISVAADLGSTGLQFIGATEHAASVNGFKKDAGTFYKMPVLDAFSPSIFWKANSNDSHRRIVFTGYSI